MNKLLAILIAGAFSAVTASAYAADSAMPAKSVEPVAVSVKVDKPTTKHIKAHKKANKKSHKKAHKKLHISNHTDTHATPTYK